MIKNILLCIFLPFTFFAQSYSTIQEQSNHYKKFSFKYDTQWDSLTRINNNSSPINSNHRISILPTCSLTKKVYGWHPYWNGNVYNNYDWSMLSDFCYFDYSVSPTTGNNTNGSFAWLTSAAVTAAISNSINVHFCATLFASHSTFLASASAQQTFITNVINLLNARPGSNGINIDFEGMSSSDKTPFTNFMTSLCNQVHAANSNYKVTLALYAVDWNSVFNISALNVLVDNFIIMGYDYYYSNSAQAGPEAPLYNFQTNYNQTLSKSITYYLKQGATKNKLLLGLPWYGREWETIATTIPSNTTGNFTTSRTYSYIKNNASTYSTANKKWDSNSFNPYYTYLSGSSIRQCWIDDNYSYSRKFDMVNQRGLGGIGIWALGYDDGYSDLWNLIKNKFSNCATVNCTDSIFDMGGPNRNYYDSESYEYTISPTGANKIQLFFNEMNLELGYDSLYVYDGNSTNASLLGSFTGTTVPNTLISNGNAITLKFKSDNATTKSGFKAIWNCIQDSVNPSTQIITPSGWITQNFTATFVDTDNSGGTGIEKSFYLPSYYNGFEWRANGARGFFYDDFNTLILNNEWVPTIGTWSISSGQLIQSDETNSNTNIYTNIAQNLSSRYLYCFNAKISGIGNNRRAGIHLFCDSPTQTNRGNNYLIYFRPDQGTIEFYKNISNTLNVVKTIPFIINANTFNNYKISFDNTTGELKLWINDVFVTSWTDVNPLTNGTSISFRSGNCNFAIDDLKIFRSRSSNQSIITGSSSSSDLRNENSSPANAAGRISSITKDVANNLSSINTTTLNIDWTKPINTQIINDGIQNDLDTTYTGTQLNINYTSAKDTNSSITNYYYAIGSSPGAHDIVNWTTNYLNLNKTINSLSLINNQKYYATVKAINGAGLISDSITSDGIIYIAPNKINEEETESNINIFPNPTHEIITIDLISKEFKTITYSLNNQLGELIEQKEIKLTPGITILKININQLKLSAGTYLLTIRFKEQQITKKIIVL